MNVVQTNNNYKLALLDLSQLIELETPEGSIWNLRQSIWI